MYIKVDYLSLSIRKKTVGAPGSHSNFPTRTVVGQASRENVAVIALDPDELRARRCRGEKSSFIDSLVCQLNLMAGPLCWPPPPSAQRDGKLIQINARFQHIHTFIFSPRRRGGFDAHIH
jgi:hypothetical protein